MHQSTNHLLADFVGRPVAVISVSPITLSAPKRSVDLQVRVSAPIKGSQLPVIVFAHGFGSSSDGYAPLANFWAAHGFVVIQPTFLDSRTLSADPDASHSDAIKTYLDNPQSHLVWRQRVNDMKHILDQLDFIEAAVPGLEGRTDKSRIAAVGHSFGAHTAGLLLGARVINADGSLAEDMSDTRIKAGVLLSAGGSGGDDLSPFAAAHFPYLNQSYAELRKPTLVVAGDNDNSPLTVRGPDWFTDAFTLSPGADWLVTLFGAEHMLGGISGYHVNETTDESHRRVVAVQYLTLAYLLSTFKPENTAWTAVCNELMNVPDALGKVEGK